MSHRLSIVDTGVLVSAAIRTEPAHRRAVAALEAAPGPRLVPSPVIVETLYLLQRARGNGAAATWLRGLIAAASAMALVEPNVQDLRRAAELMDEYADAGLDFVDAVIVAIAERLGVARVLTLDRRDFALVRPRHCTAFDILP